MHVARKAPNVGNPTLPAELYRPMLPAPHHGSVSALSEGEEIVCALRSQIEAVKAQVESHRETMLAAGLTSSEPEPQSETCDGDPS